ncbi:hypothetical protein JXR93_04285 [bacterium]|nr:hypothetical protein [bacterium]
MKNLMFFLLLITTLMACEEYSENKEFVLLNGSVKVDSIQIPIIEGQDRAIFYLIQTKDQNDLNVACDELTDSLKSEELLLDPIYISFQKISTTDTTITARIKDIYDGDYRMLLEIYDSNGTKLTSKCKTVVIDSTTTTDVSF